MKQPVFYSWVNPRKIHWAMASSSLSSWSSRIIRIAGEMERRPTSWGCPVWSPTPGKPQRNHNETTTKLWKKNLIWSSSKREFTWFYHGFLLWQVNIDEYVDHKQIISRSSTSKGNHIRFHALYIHLLYSGGKTSLAFLTFVDISHVRTWGWGVSNNVLWGKVTSDTLLIHIDSMLWTLSCNI